MKEKLIQALVNAIPENLKFRIKLPLIQQLASVNNFFSQNGEDILLQRIFHNKKKGFFVDVGAHHPVRFSNTYKLYLQGWKGINIDAMPGSMDAFKGARPQDINLEIGISDSHKELEFFVFNKPALNTFSKIEASKKDGYNGFRVVKKIKVRTQPLSDVLDENITENRKIDYLNIDVEGLDFQVLKSNNWEKYRPEIISVENLNSNVPVYKDDVYTFLNEQGYHLISVLFNTMFFIYDVKNYICVLM